ncbi:MAG TPA: TIGR00730 family Rossman fold protein [Lacibacter sp.]|nr:TIGR00730 family Rossman fold protein [Lacibacter sp.]HMO87700.1 TIGR00730 family Rossman fold protein [Lacibacter sp.]HMP88134.1 TIGR00730 family Rossman fold protein [Lacibacter sp.]
MSSIRSLAVFCGSRSGADPLYEQHARELGTQLARNGITLVYGGGSKGLMGAVADAVMEGGGTVIGVIPEVLVQWEHQHEGITQLHVVPDMHTRKKRMYELCDAALVLPGGNGTLDELFELLTWNTLQIHNKPIFLLNSNGYYRHLAAHMEQMYRQEFLYEPPADRMLMVDNPAQLFSGPLSFASDKT